MTQFPIEIGIRNLDHSDYVEADIREKNKELERFYDRIHYLRVIIEAVHRRGHKGHLYRAHITIGVPGKDIVVSRTGLQDHAHEDVYVAVRDSFRAAVRMLEDHVRAARGYVKTHEPPLHGRVARVFPYEGYGFIKTTDGSEIYFHRNSVVDGSMDDLEQGADVRFVLSEDGGVEGPQTSTVKPAGKHHIAT